MIHNTPRRKCVQHRIFTFILPSFFSAVMQKTCILQIWEFFADFLPNCSNIQYWKPLPQICVSAARDIIGKHLVFHPHFLPRTCLFKKKKLALVRPSNILNTETSKRQSRNSFGNSNIFAQIETVTYPSFNNI